MSPQTSGRILLVEDEPANRSLVRAVVSRAEDRGVGLFELIECGDLAAARRTVATTELMAILLDVRLPDGSGLDLATSIRSDPSADRPWIIVMSASVHPADQTKALDAGADLFVAKPFKPHDLLCIIQMIVDGSPTPAAAAAVAG